MERTKEIYYWSLKELVATLNSASASKTILQSILKIVTKAMGSKGCSLLLLSPNRKTLFHTVAYGLSDWYVRKGPLSTDNIIAEALGGKPIAVIDASIDDRIQYREEAMKEGIASMLSVPVLLREEIVGVIRVYTDEIYPFTVEDIHFVEAVADLGAIALENTRLYETVQTDYETVRRDILEWRAAFGHEWMMGDSMNPMGKIVTTGRKT